MGMCDGEWRVKRDPGAKGGARESAVATTHAVGDRPNALPYRRQLGGVEVSRVRSFKRWAWVAVAVARHISRYVSITPPGAKKGTGYTKHRTGPYSHQYSPSLTLFSHTSCTTIPYTSHHILFIHRMGPTNRRKRSSGGSSKPFSTWGLTRSVFYSVADFEWKKDAYPHTIREAFIAVLICATSALSCAPWWSVADEDGDGVGFSLVVGMGVDGRGSIGAWGYCDGINK
jgi:hypothetical protein